MVTMLASERVRSFFLVGSLITACAACEPMAPLPPPQGPPQPGAPRLELRADGTKEDEEFIMSTQNIMEKYIAEWQEQGLQRGRHEELVGALLSSATPATERQHED